MGHSKPVTTGDIEEALDIAARVIDKFGYKYWPIFERLEEELESRASREKRLRTRLDRLCHDASVAIELQPPQESRENS